MLYSAVALIAAAYLYPFVRMFCEAPDYGVFLNGADLLNHGAIPSRDFVEPQGPGSFVWLAFFFRLFGTTLNTARLLLDATGAGIALLAFYLSRRLGAMGIGAALFVLSTSVPLMPINSPHYDSNLFALAALALFLLAWEQARPRLVHLIAAGSLCGIVTWMIQQKGLYLAAAFVLSMLIVRQAKPAVILATAYSAVVALPFLVYGFLHCLPDVLYANYIWPASKYSELNAAPYGYPVWDILRTSLAAHTNAPAARAEDIATSVPFFLIAALPLLLPIAGWSCGRKWLVLRFLPYWLAAFALWFGELHRLDMGHLRNGVVLIAILFFSICEAAGNRFWSRIGLINVMFVALTASTNLRATLEATRTIETRRGDIHVMNDDHLIDFLQTHTRAGDEVFIYPYQPIYYFAEILKNPTRYSYLQYHLHTDAQFQEATRDLEAQKVRYVVFDSLLSGEHFEQVFPAYRQPEKSKLIMEPYLEAHYRLLSDLGRFRILERKE
jgi:hypothetical protein